MVEAKACGKKRKDFVAKLLSFQIFRKAGSPDMAGIPQQKPGLRQNRNGRRVGQRAHPSATGLHRYCGAIELTKAEAIEGFTITIALVAQNTDGHSFSQ